MDKIKYRKAEEMKDRFPSDWCLNRLKYVIATRSGEQIHKHKLNDNGLFPVYGSNGEINRSNLRNVFEQKILIGRVGACGKLNIGDNLWATDNVLIVDIISKQINFKFLYYLLFSKDLLNYASKTAQPLITGTIIRNLYWYQPPLFEQQKIANFLDLKTAQLDSIIFKKQLLIEKLEEAKKSLITEVVTGKVKIVDGQMIRRKAEEMKDSGIEWLGMIPKEWEVTQLKRLFKIKKKPIYKENNIVLSLTQKGLKVKDLDNNEGQHAVTYSGYQEVLISDFVMNHMDLLTGYVDCSPFDGVTSPDYRVFQSSCKTKVHNMFYLYFFQMCYKNKIFYGYGQGVSNFGRWRLQTEIFKYFPVIQVKYTEQVEIVNYLKRQTKYNDYIIIKQKTQIQKLEEAKKSLISEAVTGKIDLRDWEIVEGEGMN